MADKIAGSVNYLIGIVLMISILFLLRKKHKQDPNLKFLGLSFNVFAILIYIGILIDVILMIAVLTGLTKS